MKKEDILSLIVYAMMIVVAAVLSFAIISPLISKYGSLFLGGSSNQFLWVFVSLIGAIILNVSLVEIGHIIGAKIGGYTILSVNIIGFCVYKKIDKWKFGFRSFDGLTGETRIAPKKSNSNIKAYAFLPFILFLVELIAFVVIFYIATSSDNFDFLKPLGIVGLIFITVGGMIQIYNIFPARLDATNDGYRLVIMSKPINMEAYNEMMRIESVEMTGEKIESFKTFDDITDFTASVNLLSVYKYLEEDNIADAEALIDQLLENKEKLHENVYLRILAQKAYIVIMYRELDDAKNYAKDNLSSEMVRFISTDLTMESIRAYMLVSGILNGSKSEVKYAVSRKYKAIKVTNVGRVKLENKLFDDALNKIDQAYPNWKIKEKEIK